MVRLASAGILELDIECTKAQEQESLDAKNDDDDGIFHVVISKK